MSDLTKPLDTTVRDAIRTELVTLLGARANGADVVALMAQDALVGMSAVCALTDLSRPQIWRGVAAGTFPKPLAPSAGRRAWLLSEIQLWIADRKAERDAGTSGRRSPPLTAV
jgi:predicted DNA-binding transcriptional regulator AlpA